MDRPFLCLISQHLTSPASKRFSRLQSTHHSVPFPSSRLCVPRRRLYSNGPNPTPGKSPFKVWPFVAITLAGTGAYILMVKSRTGADMAPPAIDAPRDSGKLAAPKKDTPTFSASNVTVLFVLGGPGAGKGTQCDKLVRDYGFTHLSAGDLLREEQDRQGSEFGSLIKDCIKNGSIVPMEVTVQLLENAMTETLQKSQPGSKSDSKTKVKGKFLIDGFPRKMDQALRFEEAVCPAKFVLFFDVPEDVMQKRLLKRGETSGRADDNEESIKKRFKTFVDTSMPVVDYYEKQGRVVRVKATQGPDEVYALTRTKVEEKLGTDI